MSIKLKKYKKNILILLIVLIMVIGILAINLYKYSVKYSIENSKNNEIKEKVYNERMKDEIWPNGIFLLKKSYQGDNDINDFYKNLYVASNELINLSKIENKKIDKYYEDNRNEIYNTFGILKKEEFNEFLEYIQNIGKLKKLNYASINTDSFKNFNKYLEFNMSFNYDDNKELNFKINLMNKKYEKVLVKYYIIK